ncbi:hypothetical protein ACJMK2_029214 [Sinanodonta woodiana]|uniref:Uncharacterized protein n=1 Tax=Sinanodonta woodiana TaxID=1069815 RepID=A0ABD3XA04_SINWO
MHLPRQCIQRTKIVYSLLFLTVIYLLLLAGKTRKHVSGTFINIIAPAEKQIIERFELFNPTKTPVYLSEPESFPEEGPLKIETIFHQKWIDNNVLRQFENNIKSLLQNHPRWEYRFWTDNSLRKFIYDTCQYMLPIWDNYPSDMHRSNAMRYIVLYEYGGVYADLDIKFFRPLDPFVRKYSCFTAREPFVHPMRLGFAHDKAGTALMGCRRKHPFMKTLIYNLPSFSIANDRQDSVGPLFVSILYRNYITEAGHVKPTDDDGVYMAPAEYFMSVPISAVLKSLPSICHTKKKMTHSLKWICSHFEQGLLKTDISPFSFTTHEWALMHDRNMFVRKNETDIHNIVPQAILYMESN